MKKINILLVFMSIFLLSAGYNQSQGKYYYAFNEKIFLDEVAGKFVLSFDKNFLSEIQINLQRNVEIQHIEFQVDNNCCILTMEKTNIRTLRENFSKQAGIKSINPIYIIAGGSLEIGVTDEIVVQLKENVSQQALNEMYKKYNLEIIEITELYQLLSVPINLDPLDVSNAIQTSGLTNFSYPNFLAKVELCQYTPSDPYFINQYYLNNTGQTVNGRSCTAGADINVMNAWNFTKGNNSIVVAVIDEGISSNHPDLPNTRQVRLNGSNFVSGNNPNDPIPTGNDNHGNASAGIIAASHNDEGIAGIAPNCKIMPIKVPFGSNIPQTVYANAITFAKNNGADIISNSWSFDGPNNSNFLPLVVSAISDATINGRNGKGCVVVFAAGNNANHIDNRNGWIEFPANVNISGVLTVGASDRDDMQANYSPTSVLNTANNQIIDVMAPSHRAYSPQIPGETYDVWSIDIPGDAGYNKVWETDGGNIPTIGTYLPSSGTNFAAYTGYFGGTSAACPQVAGVAALMLSINPNLTQNQVATIIRATARKARNGTTYTYQTTPGRPDGTWNAQMGYGVVDAYAAVSLSGISGPSLLCRNSDVFTVTNLPSGFTWSVSSNLSIVNTSGNMATIMTSNYYYTSGSLGWVSIKNSSGTEVARKEVWVGYPDTEISGPDYAGSYQRYTASYHPLSNPTGFQWYMDEYAPITYDLYSYGSYADIYFYASNDYLLRLEACNNCGCAPASKNIHAYPYSPSPSPVVVFPNPVDDILTVEIEEQARQQAGAISLSYDIRLYDIYGAMRRQSTTKGSSVQFDVSNLPNGIYSLHIYDSTNSKPEMRTIMVRH